MKLKFKRRILSFLLLMSCFFGAFTLKAQDPPIPPIPPPPGLPIDGGLSYLFIAGIAYGVYELKRKK